MTFVRKVTFPAARLISGPLWSSRPGTAVPCSCAPRSREWAQEHGTAVPDRDDHNGPDIRRAAVVAIHAPVRNAALVGRLRKGGKLELLPRQPLGMQLPLQPVDPVRKGRVRC